MKKALLAIVSLAWALAATGVAAKDLRIGIEGAYPPFSQVNPDGSLSGFDVDIAKALCQQVGANCTLVQVDWDALIPSLQSQKIDAIVASMAITEERKQKVDFSDKYYNTPRRLVAPKSGNLKDAQLSSLQGKRVGVQRGTLADKFSTAYWLPAKVQIVRYATQDEVYLDLRAGRIDAALQDATQASSGFLKKPEGANFTFVGDPIVATTAEQKAMLGEGYGIPVRKGDEELRKSINQAIQAIRSNGTYDSIRKKYFDFEIY